MTKRILLGMLTPSSNTALEPITSAMVREIPGVSAHFSRFRVTEISLSDRALQQFDLQPLLDAAHLLADAKVDAIAWNGTSAGWLGFEADMELCRAIHAATGIPATTSILALNEIFEQTGVKKFGLVTPYRQDVQQRIVENYRRHGFECVAERHLDLQVNFSFSEVSPSNIADMIRDVAATSPQAITTFCTNLRAAPLVQRLEQETGIPIYDTISAVVWKSLKLAGADPTHVKNWGQLFQLDALSPQPR